MMNERTKEDDARARENSEEDEVTSLQINTDVDTSEEQLSPAPSTPPIRRRPSSPPSTPPRKHGRKRRNVYDEDDDDDDVIVSPIGFGGSGRRCEQCQRQGKRKFGTLANNWRDGWFQPLANFSGRFCSQHSRFNTNADPDEFPLDSIRRNLFSDYHDTNE